MKEIYDWVPWFTELAQKVNALDEPQLLEKATAIWGDGERQQKSILNYEEYGIDPLSFFYFLSGKIMSDYRETTQSRIETEFGLNNRLETEKYYLPHKHQNSLLFYGDEENWGQGKELCWELFQQAVAGNLEQKSFQQVLNIKNVGITKLTQTLFLINPKTFSPIDDTGPLALAEECDLPSSKAAKKQIKKGGVGAYVTLQKQIKAKFPGCEFYEINTLAHLITHKKTKEKITINPQYWQIDTNVYDDGDDHWKNFEENNGVWTKGPGTEEDTYHLNGAEKGDMILVRLGTTTVKGIGVVYQNDYKENKDNGKGNPKNGWEEQAKIHVLWLIKEEKKLSESFEPMMGFSSAEVTPEQFEETYPETFSILKKLEKLKTNNEDQDTPNNEDQYTPEEETDNEDKISEHHNPYEHKNTYKGELNTIFYGPPGTGKTYTTISEAVKIADHSFHEAHEENDRAQIRAKFNELKEAGQIAFITFHQSFNYEEFIEGIKPKLEQGGALSYEIGEGIFKKICNEALKNYENPQLSEEDSKEHLATKELLRKFVAHIETQLDNGKTITLPDSENTITGVSEHPKSNISFILGGSINYPRRLSEEIILRDFDNFMKGKITKPIQIKQKNNANKEHGNAAIYLRFFKMLKAFKENNKIIETTEKQALKNYVLIIDEINRGNISKIFGELITLIEPDKRIGNTEALTTQLPYSTEKFGVPNNLYIIGTMNTADRSLTLLDSALRRRFVFEEMMPDLKLLEQIKVGKIEIATMLGAINKRICERYDREHQIGHSFFLGLKEDPSIEKLAAIFATKILPLLEEYFYDERDKINEILNDNRFYTEEEKQWERKSSELENAENYEKIYNGNEK